MKKLVCILLVLAMVLGCSCAMAGSVSSWLKKTTKTVVAYTVVGMTNAAVDAVVKGAQKTARDDGALAVFVTECMTGAAKNVTDKLGVAVTCEYEEKVIDGKAYMVDPLRVIPVTGGKK